ncbi:MAG: DNA/RNA helicase [Zetaproteobacteria bacterium CG_4_10_14_3_um_filter_54_28]|nr:MAG: DNA/RNA helicase [Zetaproteobacteria bacterium CG_4_10_14_3_um_filter_54_28]
MIVSPSRYQKDAKDNALSIFRYALQQIEGAPDEANRRQAAAYNGCVLIEAPTGSGKTMMAGMIAEEFAREAKIVWFWFTPFAGLVDQASIALKKQFGGLRVRDIQGDRLAMGTKSGDVFVSTWAAVAANNEKARRLRRDGDLSLSLDSLIPSLRELGFHIGVVVDEAHHTFGSATEAVRFYTEVMQPEFTLLITATPDDKDVDKFKRTTGIAELHRITVSRQDAVDAGMIKAGIKSVAYLAPDDQKALVDFRMAALADAKAVHERIKQELQAAGINLMPLMLVQVATTEKDDDVAQARAALMQLGFREDAIASYTSKEPSDDLLAVALDETKEVLIFKMAVALGFDAPRAFTLVSMRGAKDTDFGIQVVGRILRVHRRLQGREVPELLRNGYVFLADADNQRGLTSAGEKINSLRTGLSDISPYTMVVNIAGQNQVQVVKNGQSTMLPVVPQSPAIPNTAQDSNIPVYAVTGSLSNGMQNVLEGFVMALPSAQNEQTRRIVAELSGASRFTLKQPSLKFKTEYMPLGTDALLACIGGKVALGDRELSEGRRAKTTVIRREEEIFTRSITDTQYQARISESEIARRAQRVLFEPDYLDPRDLHAVLIKRLKSEYEARGWDYDERELELVLDLVLVAFPSLIRQSARECAAQYAELKDTAPLPDVIELPSGARTSRLNVYGVMPPDLNRDELAFAEMLDADLSGTVEWWHRNEPRKPWSIGLILPNGAQYFPDLVVKVNGRTQGGGLLLIEIKGDHILNSGDTLDKVLASHQLYKRPVMLMREDSGRFMTIRQDTNGKNSPDQIFRLDLMVGY